MSVSENYSGTEAEPMSVHAAACELTRAAERMTDCKPFHLAQKKIDECGPDDVCSRFWRSVWIKLASAEYGVD